jgi:hypothetical protein
MAPQILYCFESPLKEHLVLLLYFLLIQDGIKLSDFGFQHFKRKNAFYLNCNMICMND